MCKNVLYIYIWGWCILRFGVYIDKFFCIIEWMGLNVNLLLLIIKMIL